MSDDLTDHKSIGSPRARWNWRRTFLVVAVVVVVGSVWYSRLIPAMYRSEALITVAPEFSPYDESSQAEGKSQIEEGTRFMLQVCNSRTFLERFIEQYTLFGYGVRSQFIMEDAVSAARKAIRIERAYGDSLRISFVGADPKLARAVTRSLMLELIRIWNSSVKERAVAKVQFLNEQLRQVKDALASCDDKMLQIKEGQSAKTELMVLSREKAAFQNQLDELYHMEFKAKLEGGFATSRPSKWETFIVIDDANLPVQPIASNRRLILLVGILVGFVLVLIANPFKALGRKR